MPTNISGSEWDKDKRYVVVTSIASGQTVGDSEDVSGCTLTAIEIPVALTGASITFTASQTEGGTYYTVRKEDGTAYTISGTTNAGYFKVDPLQFTGIRFLKVVSASAEGSTRTINLITRPFV